MKKLLIILAALFSFVVMCAQAAESLSESGNGVGFKTVDEALTFLKTKPGVSITVTKPDGWIIANDSSSHAVWSFTPEVHYAHPSVVKREIVQDASGGISVNMTALCQAQKEPCDRLIAEFQELNSRIRKNVQEKINK